MSLLREIRLELSACLFFLSILGMVVGVSFYLSPQGSPDFLRTIHGWIGDWIVWVTFLGLLGMFMAGWYFLDLVWKQRQFRKLLEAPSRTVFVRNLDRTEEIARDLSAPYRKLLWEKKEELKIKE